MISADVKANKNKKNQKIWWLYISNVYKKHLRNLKCNVKGNAFFISQRRGGGEGGEGRAVGVFG